MHVDSDEQQILVKVLECVLVYRKNVLESQVLLPNVTAARIAKRLFT